MIKKLPKPLQNEFVKHLKEDNVGYGELAYSEFCWFTHEKHALGLTIHETIKEFSECVRLEKL